MNRTLMRSQGVLAVVVLALLALACGSDGTPTQPTPGHCSASDTIGCDHGGAVHPCGRRDERLSQLRA